jgi:CheY-like chemotaxis protein
MTAKRILLVEDNADLRNACAQVLESFGHTVVAVDDGAVALDEIAHRPPDVIVLDLIMPMAELDGVTLLSRLADGSRIPIVILSGLGDALAEALSSNVLATLPIAAILHKPCPFDVLTREIDRVGGRDIGTEDSRPR